MRVKYIANLALMALLVLVFTTNSNAGFGYISTVEISIDGFVCATCARTIEQTLSQEDGVAEVSGDWKKGLVGVTIDQDAGWANLFDFAQRINGTRNYKVLDMTVVAVGRVTKEPVEYYTGGLYAYSGDRYRLQIKDGRKAHFLLTSGEKLEELINSGHDIVRVTGTVSAFSERVPILRITEFGTPGEEEKTEMVRAFSTTREAIPDHIVSVELYVDGFICATCVRELETNLLAEEGVGSVEADLETGIVTVIPAFGEETVDPFYLRRRINTIRDYLHNYTVRRMDVEAVGTITKFPARYFRAREYSHHHDRYKLQVGDKYFVFAENRKLQELLDSGLGRARVKGTIVATSEGKSILAIGDFKPLGGKSLLEKYTDPLDKLAASLVGEINLDEKEEYAGIDSIRVYVDGFICETCARPLKEALLLEEGLKIAATDARAGLIELVPEEGATIDLHDIEQRINAMREYGVLRMEVVTTGKIQKTEAAYAEDTIVPEKNTRYTLSSGESGSFILSENDKLAEILKTGDKNIVAVGTVSAFWGHTPILYIRDYKKLEERPE